MRHRPPTFTHARARTHTRTYMRAHTRTRTRKCGTAPSLLTPHPPTHPPHPDPHPPTAAPPATIDADDLLVILMAVLKMNRGQQEQARGGCPCCYYRSIVLLVDATRTASTRAFTHTSARTSTPTSIHPSNPTTTSTCTHTFTPLQMLRDRFVLGDENGDGFLSLEEFSATLRTFTSEVTPSTAEELFSRVLDQARGRWGRVGRWGGVGCEVRARPGGRVEVVVESGGGGGGGG